MFQVIILSEAKSSLSDVQALSPEASQMKWLVQDCNEARGVCIFMSKEVCGVSLV